MDAGSGGSRGRLRTTKSAEMRWVASGGAFEEDEIESSDDGGADDNPTVASGSRAGGGSGEDDDDYEEEEMLRQRLVRTGPRADSLDVEALDVPGVYRHQTYQMAPANTKGKCDSNQTNQGHEASGFLQGQEPDEEKEAKGAASGTTLWVQHPP